MNPPAKAAKNALTTKDLLISREKWRTPNDFRSEFIVADAFQGVTERLCLSYRLRTRWRR